MPATVNTARPFTVELFALPRGMPPAERGNCGLVYSYGLDFHFKQHGGNAWVFGLDPTDHELFLVRATDASVVGRKTHLAAVVTEEEMRLFVDGTLAKKIAIPRTRGSKAGQLGIGLTLGDAANWSPFQGLVDEVRVSQVARYDKDFSPRPRLETDIDTLALYHFDEGSGDVLKDSSGHNHHGKVIGAKWVRANGSASDLAAPSVPSSTNLLTREFVDRLIKTVPGWGNSPEGPVVEHTTQKSPNAEVRDWKPNETILRARVRRLSAANNANLSLGFREGWDLPEVRGRHAVNPDGSVEWRIEFNPGGGPQNVKVLARMPATTPVDQEHIVEFRFAGGKAELLVDDVPLLKTENVVVNPKYASLGVQNSKWLVKSWTSHAPSALGSLPSAVPPMATAPFDAKQARMHQEAWAKHLGTTVETTNSVGAKMVFIPPGEFLMGSTDEQIEAALKAAAGLGTPGGDLPRIREDEKPRHSVLIQRPLLVSATEVTIGQFRKFVEAARYETEGERSGGGDSSAKSVDDPVKKARTWQSPGYPVGDDSPVTQVTWNDAVAFCNWLSTQENFSPCYEFDKSENWQVVPDSKGYRLPTEAEWEYACRAGTTTQYSFGDNPAQLDQYAWHDRNFGKQARPVGTKLPNPFGLYDMHGNVWEWCQDWHDRQWYQHSPKEDPTGPPTGTNRVIRGGTQASHSRSAYRHDFYHLPSARHGFYGFRCVRVLAVSPIMNAGNSTLDLIALFDIDKGVAPWRNDGAKNQWSRQGSELKFNADGKPGLVKFPTMRLLDANYRLELEFTRTSGTNGFNLDLPLSSGLFSINLDEGDRGRTGLGKSDQFTDSFHIEPNRRYRLTIIVEGQNQQDSIRLEVDGNPLLAWQGDRQKAAVPTRGASAENTKWPGFWVPARGSSFTIHRFQVLQISSETQT